MNFIRKNVNQRSTIVLSLVDLLQPNPNVMSFWSTESSEDSLKEWTAKSIVRSSDGSPSTAIDKALATRIQASRIHPISANEFDRDNLISWNAWHHGGEVHVALKGALEPLLAHTRLTENEQENIRLQMTKMTKDSRQVLAVAHCILHSTPKGGAAIINSGKLVIDGLVSLEYPALATTASLVENLRAGNQPVKLISGESVETIAELISKWNISDNPDVFDCRQLATLGNAAIDRIKGIDIFARVDSESLPLLLNNLRQNAPLSATANTKQYFEKISTNIPSIQVINML